MNRRIVLFDLDGTITDPTPGFRRSIRHALEVVGAPPIDDSMLGSLIGPPLRDGFAAAGVAPGRIDEAIDAYRDIYGAGALHEAPLHDGVAELIASLVGAEGVLGLVTSKPWVYAEPILDGHDLRDRFTVVGGSELDGTNAPKRDVVRATLAALGHPDPADVVLVGDRHHDVEGARANGIASVGVGWGFADDGELWAAGADHVVHDIGELALVLGIDDAAPRVRRAVRVLVVDDRDRILLVHWALHEASAPWLVPGGGIEPGERAVEAAARELAEEVGLTGVEIGPVVLTRQFSFRGSSGRWAGQRESWRLVRVSGFDPPPVEELPEAVTEGITEIRWVELDDLDRTIGGLRPELVPAVCEIVTNGPPDRPFAFNDLVRW